MREPILPPDATLRDAVRVIEWTRRKIAVVIDADRRLLGTVSDGDIRRSILAGNSLESPTAEAMAASPITGDADLSNEELLDILWTKGVAAIPLVDAEGRFVRVVQASDLDPDEPADAGAAGYAAAVIMAGGEGRRLWPLTKNRPKAMIDIGGIPLLERQVRSMVQVDLRRIYISTNYLGHLIEEHFGDGSDFGAEIYYVRENRKLGTAGALSLLPERPAGPLLVINGDILTTSDYGKLYHYHQENGALITVGAVEYRVNIPFGVVRVEGARAVGFEEKPTQRYLCNAGIYVLAPDVLDLIPPDSPFDMTEMIENAIALGHNVTVFPIHEYWTDIGSRSDLRRAREKLKRL